MKAEKNQIPEIQINMSDGCAAQQPTVPPCPKGTKCQNISAVP
jgi:hypothetical protein